MTLIPLISAILTAPEATVAAATPTPAGGAGTFSPRNAYGSDGGRHPVAALLAIGMPLALVVAVALSPMVVKTLPRSEPIPGTIVELPKPPPPPDPTKKADPTPKTAATTDAVDPIVDTPPLTGDTAQPGPLTPEPHPYDPGPPVKAADPPAPPKLVFADLDPRYAGGFQPDYPAREQRGGIEGVAKVRVLIGTDGRVKAVELVSADSPGFFEETRRRALAKWRFKPATRGGVPEESWKVMTVRFEIKNA